MSNTELARRIRPQPRRHLAAAGPVRRPCARGEPRRAEPVPRHGQAGRLGLQPGLHLLLLPEQGHAARRAGQRPHDRRDARGVHPPVHRRRDGPRGGVFLAGRRADADGPGFLPARGRAREEIRQARPEDRERPADQRHAARRGLVPVPQGEPLSRRPEHRRPEEAPRRLPRRQGRLADVRQGVRGGQAPAEARRAVQHADLHQPRSTPSSRWTSTGSCAGNWAPPTCSSFPSSSTRLRGTRRALEPATCRGRDPGPPGHPSPS